MSNEHRLAPPVATPVADVQVLTAADLDRALRRIAHEIVERNHGADDLVLLGLQHGGVPVAQRLGDVLAEFGHPVPVGTLDVSGFRDDRAARGIGAAANVPGTDVPLDLTGHTVVLVDDVLHTGRTVRAALDATNAHGRAGSIQLAVLVDRGHRELPIRPDFVGKNLPTRPDDFIDVEVDSGVTIRHRPDPVEDQP